MRKMNKVITAILSALVCIMTFTGSSFAGVLPGTGEGLLTGGVNIAAAETDLNKMASALNKLSILQGENGDYKLASQTKRAEAAAFIIRMLGKTNYVIQNTEQLKYTKFTDIPATKWYAPYIGYCSINNILSGKTVSTFAPDEFTTEKQFLKMALGALGYIEGTDFDWSNIYQKAYSVGIVTDQSYISRTQDNKNYLRSEAVKVIYLTLNTPKKGTQKKLAYSLVDEGLFSASAIAASGVIKDDQTTAIDLITTTAPDKIEINLNENIQSVNASDVVIGDSTTSSALSVKSLTYRDDRIYVTTSGQISGRSYTVKINSITDINGNISGNITGSFKGYVQQQISSDFFRISKVEQQSTNVINIYFTQPVNSNSEIPAYYEITKNGTTFINATAQYLAVKKLPSAENAVSVLLKNISLASGDVYGVKISGKLSSSYGAKLGNGSGESMDFVSTTVNQSGSLDVSSVQAASVATLKILFSREIDPAWAGRRINYTVYDPYKHTIDVTNAVVSENGGYIGREVTLTLASSLDKTKQYEVKIEYIPDIYKQGSIEGKTYSFSGAYPDNVNLALSQASSDFNNGVSLLFNKALDAATAVNKSNYSIRGLTDSSFNVIPEKVYYTEQYGQYIVKLYLPAGKTLSGTQRYTVYAAGLKDSFGVVASVLKTDFTGGSNSVVKPQIADAVTVASDTIKLRFNVEIAFDVNNINTTNYFLEYVENGETIKMAPVGVTYVDANTLVLKFDELDQTKSYQIRFNSITDYSGIYPRLASDGGNTSAVRWGK